MVEVRASLPRSLPHCNNRARNARLLQCKKAVSNNAHVLQAVTIIGGGRVGQALADMGPGTDVSV
jgi:hypothetical protein